eukprot:5729059-Karenia_brevis.AAC.1
MRVLNSDNKRSDVWIELLDQNLQYIRLAILSSLKDGSQRSDHGVQGDKDKTRWVPKRKGFLAQRSNGQTKLFKANPHYDDEMDAARNAAREWAD